MYPETYGPFSEIPEIPETYEMSQNVHFVSQREIPGKLEG